jgi:hypothetical protein
MDFDIEVESRTVKNILYARKHNGLYSSIVTGKRGVGKSSYCIQVLYRVFRALGVECDEAWQMALDRTLYTIPDIIDFLDQATDKSDKDIFIWDDAGVFAGGVRWLTNQQEMVFIESICDTLRDSVYGLLFNVPDVRTLSRRLRSYDDYLVKIHRLKDKDKQKIQNNMVNGNVDSLREARLYNKTITPAGQVRVYKQYYDTFDVMLPDWVYNKYKEKRHKYTKDNIVHLKELLKKSKE